MYVNAKMIPVVTITSTGLGWIKESSGGEEFKYDIFDTSYHLAFVNAKIYPHIAQQ
jgi:hypothetical protein